MEEKELKKFQKAGKIASEVAKDSRELIRPGDSLLLTAHMIERWIHEKNAAPAFPVNISLNNEASHATPAFNDKTSFTERDLVNIDIGVHVDGYVGGDTAYTIDLSGEHPKLVEASRKALDNALATVRAGTQVNKIGAVIEKTITEHGYKPIQNLSGHGLDHYEVHCPPSIPNIDDGNKYKLKEGQIIAIEPFATTGTGRVREGTRTEIFSYAKPVLTRNMEARKISAEVEKDYLTLPFAERWLSEKHNPLKLRLALKELVNRGGLIAYPVLKDSDSSLVSQAEVTLIVEKDSCKVISPLEKA